MQTIDRKRFDEQYRKHLAALKLHNLADSTIDVYSRAVRRLVNNSGHYPEQISKEQCREHFLNLIDDYSWSTVTSDRAGLMFFFKHVLDTHWDWDEIVKPKRAKTLPNVISHRQVGALLSAAWEPRYKCFFLVAYSMGLRLREALKLEIQDIDAEQMRVHVRLGKGRVDRYVILPQITLDALRHYWSSHRHPRLLFPTGRNPMQQLDADKPMSKAGVQRAIKLIAQHAGITTPVTTHTLRHCYATHLLERGLSLGLIQEQLGHRSIKTTLIYTKLTECAHQNAQEMINSLVEQLPPQTDHRGEDEPR